VLIAQITDCHIVAPGEVVADRVDPSVGLRDAITTLGTIDEPVRLVLGTGDLVNDGRPSEYDRLEELLADLPLPFVPIPGNHDDRGELRRRFERLPAGAPDDPIDHVVDLGELRVVCLDTTIPGSHEGRLTTDQLAWLDAALAERTDVPALIAQHHPPFGSGLPFMELHAAFHTGPDEATVVGRHPHVTGVVCGHFHRAMHRPFAGTVASVAPSTAVQMALRMRSELARYADEPTGFALHRFDGDGVITHLVPTAPSVTWTPAWALDDAP
jgi:Icc protein